MEPRLRICTLKRQMEKKKRGAINQSRREARYTLITRRKSREKKCRIIPKNLAARTDDLWSDVQYYARVFAAQWRGNLAACTLAQKCRGLQFVNLFFLECCWWRVQ